MPDAPRHPSAGTAAEPSHLSIGEVLGLLLEEFPDVTISKIRFLESQGLIAPERTPSGYRKFFDDDVELLRVILREQRENYLPLRVIKDRISSGELDPSGENTIPRGIRNVSTAQDDRSNDDTQPVEIPRTVHDDRSGGDDQQPGDHRGSDDYTEAATTSEPRQRAVGDTAPIPTIGPSGRGGSPEDRKPGPTPSSDTTSPAGDKVDETLEETPNHVDESSTQPASVPPSAPPAEPAPVAEASAEACDESTVPTEEPSTFDEPAPPQRRAGGPTGPPSREPASAPTAATGSPKHERPSDSSPSSPPQLLPGVTLTLDELSAMVGATSDEIKQLEEYGIVVGRESAGEHVYDEDAVTVARIGVQFLRYGVDARHLRGWKTAADREAGIYEQLITPLLRRRNPQGRQEASEQLQRMNELGSELRAALMQIALRSIDRH